MHKPVLSQDKHPLPHPSRSKCSPTCTYVSPALWVPVPPPPSSGPHAGEKASHRLTYMAPGAGPYWQHHAVTLLAGCRLLTAPDREIDLYGLSRSQDAGRVTSGSVKPGFDYCVFALTDLSSLLQIFMLLWYFLSGWFLPLPQSLLVAPFLLFNPADSHHLTLQCDQFWANTSDCFLYSIHTWH